MSANEKPFPAIGDVYLINGLNFRVRRVNSDSDSYDDGVSTPHGAGRPLYRDDS